MKRGKKAERKAAELRSMPSAFKALRAFKRLAPSVVPQPTVGADPRVCPNKGVGLSASKSFKNLFQNLSKWAYDNSCLTSYALFEFLDVQEIRGAIIFTPILPNLQNIGKNYFKSGLTESSKVSLLTYPLFTLLKANSLMRPRFTNPIMSLLAVVALTKNLF